MLGSYHDLRPLPEVPLFVPSIWLMSSAVQVALDARQHPGRHVLMGGRKALE